ncbi:MAG: 3-phosphoshikimate 1-carboxyvinyltransferase [Planctomycetes bacterium]|nr:3-phosphoshikimate 1-carboxyvinyltransferase [Planctomycetota bacterium]
MPAGPLTIPALSGPLDTTWRVPGSKSITNRALVLAALADGTSVIENVLASDDTRHMRQCLERLGIVMRDGAPGQVIVDGGRGRLRANADALFVGNSGTTVRFLTALATLVPGSTTLAGDQHMAKRPIADLVSGLVQLGVELDCPTGCPPITVRGGKLAGGTLRMRGDRSSQYFSAVLMAAGLAESDVRVLIDGELVSRPYVDMTRRMVADFGGRIDADDAGFTVRRVPSYRARSYVVEPDASSASYPFAFAAAGGHRISVPAMSAASLQGDYDFVKVLELAGATVERRPDATVVRGGTLHGLDVDMHHISDTVMTLAAIAPLMIGPTTIRNVANIRIKETDRLSATVNELRRVGQQVDHGDDWLKITPRPLKPATIECYSDHRMAMSFAVLAACARDQHWDASVPVTERQIRIADPACTAKTYPGFWDDLAVFYPGGLSW